MRYFNRSIARFGMKDSVAQELLMPMSNETCTEKPMALDRTSSCLLFPGTEGAGEQGKVQAALDDLQLSPH